MGKSKTSRKRSASRLHVYREVATAIKREAKRRSGKIKRGKPRSVRAPVACHLVFDRLWSGLAPAMTRWAAYEYLQRITGLSEAFAHIRYFDADQCKFVARRVKTDYPRLFGEHGLDAAKRLC